MMSPITMSMREAVQSAFAYPALRSRLREEIAKSPARRRRAPKGTFMRRRDRAA